MGKARWTVVSAGIAAVLGAIAIVTGEVPGVVASRSARGGVDGEAWRAHLASVDRAIDEDDVKSLMRSGATDGEIAALVRRNLAGKWEGHEINSAKFVAPPRPMYSIGG